MINSIARIYCFTLIILRLLAKLLSHPGTMLLSVSVISPLSFSANTEKEADWQQLAHDFHYQRLTEAGYNIDKLEIDFNHPMLSSWPCDSDSTQIQATGENLLGTVKVELACPQQTITLNNKVQVWIPIVVSKKPIPAGTQIRSSDLTLVSAEVSRLHTGYFTNLDKVTGFDVRRALPANKILSPLLIQPPLLIEKGDLVTITANVPGLRISTQGIAMTSGRLGKQISVKNLNSGKIIRVKVVDKLRVETI